MNQQGTDRLAHELLASRKRILEQIRKDIWNLGLLSEMAKLLQTGCIQQDGKDIIGLAIMSNFDGQVEAYEQAANTLNETINQFHN